MTTDAVIDVNHLTFSYPRESEPVLQGVDLHIPSGSRTLLLGRNGAGKSTLLRIMGGKHMIPLESVHVLGRPAFHDTSLAADVAFLGGPFPFTADIKVREILDRTANVDPRREARLLQVLDIDPAWRMYRLSDGQRRRVQLLLGLLHPAKIILLDEVTTDLDIVARADLLQLLREESEQRGVTVVYATHILDGLYEWATHLVWIDRGRVQLHARMGEVEDIERLRREGSPSPLLRAVEKWFRQSGMLGSPNRL